VCVFFSKTHSCRSYLVHLRLSVFPQVKPF
jgi:hypothetical protein